MSVKRFSKEYHFHMNSEKWKKFAGEMRQARGYRCEDCHQNGVLLDVHHKHYNTFGNEKPEDVDVLCRRCHDDVHEKWDFKERTGLYYWFALDLHTYQVGRYNMTEDDEKEFLNLVIKDKMPELTVMREDYERLSMDREIEDIN